MAKNKDNQSKKKTKTKDLKNKATLEATTEIAPKKNK